MTSLARMSGDHDHDHDRDRAAILSGVAAPALARGLVASERRRQPLDLSVRSDQAQAIFESQIAIRIL
jgi:hypothetical protein